MDKITVQHEFKKTLNEALDVVNGWIERLDGIYECDRPAPILAIYADGDKREIPLRIFEKTVKKAATDLKVDL